MEDHAMVPVTPGSLAEGVLRGKEVELRILTSRAFGLRALIEPLWKSLGLEGALRGFAAEHLLRCSPDGTRSGLSLHRRRHRA